MNDLPPLFLDLAQAGSYSKQEEVQNEYLYYGTSSDVLTPSYDLAPTPPYNFYTTHGPALPEDDPEQLYDNWGGELANSEEFTDEDDLDWEDDDDGLGESESGRLSESDTEDDRPRRIRRLCPDILEATDLDGQLVLEASRGLPEDSDSPSSVPEGVYKQDTREIALKHGPSGPLANEEFTSQASASRGEHHG